MSKQDYYELLGAKKSDSQAELKKAYHKLAMQLHPDRNPNNKEAEKKFKEINEAYDILKDEQKRAAYDKFGHNAFQGSGGFNHRQGEGGYNPNDLNDIFGDFFSDFMGGGGRRANGTQRSAQIRGSDLKYNLTINLEEAFNGLEKNITFNTEAKCKPCNGTGSEDKAEMINCDNCKGRGATRIQQGFFAVEQTCSKCQGVGQIIKNPCKTCHGMGRTKSQKNLLVTIPAGIENGTHMRLSSEGEAGIRGGGAGDLYVIINIKQHAIYKVEGSDIHCRLPINIVQGSLGDEVDLPAIEGGKISLKIPAGTQNGDILPLKAKGMSQIRSSNRGDMYAHVHVEIPKNPTKKQRELLEALGKEFKEDSKDDASFFDKMKSLWS